MSAGAPPTGDERRCGLCRKQPAAPGHHACAACLPNMPRRKPIDETLAAIDASLAANIYAPQEGQ